MSESIFACDSCEASFASRNALFRHLREEHSDVKEIAAPPSKEWEAERQAAPEVHAKKAAGKKTDKKKKKLEEDDKPEEKKSLRIDVRPESYHEELKGKVGGMQALLDGFGSVPLPAAEVFESPPEHFRMRVEFDIWHHDNGPHYAMHAGKDLVVVEDYPMACRLITEMLMPITLQSLRDELVLRQQLFQINFHATLSGDAMVSLLYRTNRSRSERKECMLAQGQTKAASGKIADAKLTDEWEEAATRLSSALSGASVVGRTRGNKRVIRRLWVEEELQVVGAAQPLRYRQLEGFFTQSNASVCQHMLAWSRAVAYADDAKVGAVGPPRDDDLLELYCGNGNFCVALAPFFRKVFATEMVKELLDATTFNAKDNGATNISVGRVSAEELALAMEGARSFVRLEHVDFSNFNFQTVLVDPPRAGLGPEVATFLLRFPRILYVSCNPETLRDDLNVLCKTHDITRLAAFDQFAYTNHLEMGILLVKRPAATSD